MANEDLIYRITRAVYDRLGASTPDQTVEQLVTEIYREVEPFIVRSQSSSFRKNTFLLMTVSRPEVIRDRQTEW